MDGIDFLCCTLMPSASNNQRGRPTPNKESKEVMAKIKKKGESGAATNFISRNQALKKLQITLADFRYVFAESPT